MTSARALAFAIACCGCAAASSQSEAPASNLWSVTVLGDSSDPRFPAVEEAIGHWNALLDSIGARIRLRPPITTPQRLSADVIRRLESSIRARDPRRPRELDSIHGDLVIAFADFEIISYGYSPQRLGRGFIALRPANMLPLMAPNVARNVAAHEIGHVLGLPHNGTPGMLMCSGPLECRPIAFRSATAMFFPLTPIERHFLADRWH